MNRNTALIVIDTGFSKESMHGADRVLAVRDLLTGFTACGAPYLSAEVLGGFADDPRDHGSIVLTRLRESSPQSPLILIRAMDRSGQVISTDWSDTGEIAADGWTEAYLWAVELCKQLGIPSVANCSFGGVSQDLDGTGWESHQIGTVSGQGKPGHMVVAAAGPGDGRAAHASWITAACGGQTINVQQDQSSQYSFWAASQECDRDWTLEVWGEGRLIQFHRGVDVPFNIWNGRQLQTVSIEGQGRLAFVFKRSAGGSEAFKTDCFVVDGQASFLDHVDPYLVTEPAVYQQVIAVGLKHGSYSPWQNQPGLKPDVLVDGDGPISFRAPEVTARVARLLDANACQDVEAVRRAIGKVA